MATSVLFMLLSLFAVVELSTIPLETKPPGCMHEGKWYPEGPISDNPCQPCHCDQGRVICAVVDCFFPPPCVDATTKPGQCCPSCPNGANCRAPNGKVIPAGTDVTMENNSICRCPDQGHLSFMGVGAALCIVPPTTAIIDIP